MMDFAVRATCIVIGLLGLLLYFRSIVLVMLLNRREPDFVERLARSSAVTIIHGMAGSGRRYKHVQRIQAWTAPLFILFAVTTWFLLVLFSFTLILWALRAEPSWARALSSSGSALSTLGFLTPATLLGEYLAICEAAIGLAIVILLFTFVPGYQAAVQVRERKVGWLYARTGRHPNVVTLLEALSNAGHLNDPEVWKDWEIWFRGVFETHTIAPILAYVPSVYPGTTWVGASAAVLDATSLLLAAVEPAQTDAARICRETGVMAVRIIASELHGDVPNDAPVDAHLDANISAIFDQLYDNLPALGLTPKVAKDECLKTFGKLRSEYAASLNYIAKSTLMPIEPLHDVPHNAPALGSHGDQNA